LSLSSKVGIGPFRVLTLAKKFFPDYEFPSEAMTKLENNDLVSTANDLCLFYDSDFKIRGKSIGTKTEIANYKDKISSVYFWNGAEFIDDINNFNFDFYDKSDFNNNQYLDKEEVDVH